jgi:hypothetical protein
MKHTILALVTLLLAFTASAHAAVAATDDGPGLGGGYLHVASTDDGPGVRGGYIVRTGVVVQ